MNLILLISITVAELILIVLVLLFFKRLRRSEEALENLQNNHEEVLDKMLRNANLEQEMLASFVQRQEQLERLNIAMEERIYMLKKIIKEADEISHSPYLLREVILNCRKKGMNLSSIAQKTGLAKDEIELILRKENML